MHPTLDMMPTQWINQRRGFRHAGNSAIFKPSIGHPPPTPQPSVDHSLTPTPSASAFNREFKNASVGGRLVRMSSKKNRSGDEEMDECPSYAAVRETADGRSYTLKRVTQGRKSVLQRKFCRERKAIRPISNIGKRPASVERQGEDILKAIADPHNSKEEEELDKARHEFRANRQRTVWLGVTNDELDCWDSRFLGYQFGQQLGKGSFGSVHEACKDANCKFVLKISTLKDSFDKEVAEREIAIMQQLNSSGLIAKLVKSKMCGDKALMLMERYDISAEQLGKNQFSKFFGSDGANFMENALLFTDTQIQNIFGLAVKLSDLGVHHGDLKLDNILYRVADDRFIVIDFGFTGTYREFNGKLWTGRWGFTHAMGCSQDVPVNQNLAKYSNLWQLLVDLGSSYPIVLVAIEDPTTKSVKELRLLVGLGPKFAKILTKEAIKEIQKECPEPKGELWQARKQYSAIRDQILRKIQPYWV